MGRAPSRSVTIARHGRLPRPRAIGALLKFVAAALAVALISGVSLAAITLAQLRGNVETVSLPDQEGVERPAPVLGAYEGQFSILIVGSDECVDPGGCDGEREQKLADFTMLLHVAEDHQSAVAVSFPRDMIVPIPACPGEGGDAGYSAMSAQQLNASYTYGGLTCTVLTVRELTGAEIPFAGVMNFNGVREISTAIGGVPVCIDAPIRDTRSGLDLPTSGEHLVQGEQALQFLRTRYGIGDGSDTARIGAQQAFLSSMLRKITSEDTLTDPGKLFSLATVTSRNMLLSDNLTDFTLASLALVFRDIPLENIAFVKYPSGSRESAPGRVFPDADAAADLFARIEAGEPVLPDQSEPGVGTVDAVPPTAGPTPTPSPTPDPSAGQPSASATPLTTIPGATGQTADQARCSKANN